MKNNFFAAFAAIAVLCLAAPVFAQAGPVQSATPTQQTAAMLNAAQAVVTATGTAQQTLTAVCPGSYVYVVSIEVISTATTAPALTALTHTTTNLGSPTSIKLFDVFPAATGVVKTLFYPGVPLKATNPSTAVTVVTNAAVTNITWNATMTYYCGG